MDINLFAQNSVLLSPLTDLVSLVDRIWSYLEIGVSRARMNVVQASELSGRFRELSCGSATAARVSNPSGGNPHDKMVRGRVERTEEI